MTENHDDGLFLDQTLNPAFLLHTPKHIAAAVSGGSDSMALLNYLQLWAADKDIRVCAVTVDHGLRGAAAAEAAYVADYCASHHIPHTILKWTAWDGAGNLQAQARDARYSLMAAHARESGIDTIALGHTQDDQAENFLMRLSRKAGVDGLAAMESVFQRDGVTWVRPMLTRSRAQARAHLERHGITWCEDPSNEDIRFERVQARKILAQLAPLKIESAGLAQVSHHMAMAKGALQHYTVLEAVGHAVTEGGDLLLPRRKPIHPEIVHRLKVGALQWIGRGRYAPRHSAMVNLEAGLSLSGEHSLVGCHVSQTEKWVRFTREWNAVKDVHCPTDAVWDGRWRFNGPHEPGLEVRALGEGGVRACPNWRDVGLPRRSLLGTPAIWRGDELVAAPLAGVENSWTVDLLQPFTGFLSGDQLPR